MADARLLQQQNKILIVDDEADVAFIMSMVLEENGFQVDSHTDPISASRNFRDGIYHLVIMDIKMPGVDGFHFYQKIRRTDSQNMFFNCK